MSRIQRCMQAILPKHWAADMEVESRRWTIRCPKCGYECSYWDVGGIRWKASGSPRLYRRCPQCGKLSWRRTYYKPIPGPKPPL